MRPAISGSRRHPGGNRRESTRHTQWPWQHAVGPHSPGPTGLGVGRRGRHHTPVADVRVPRHAAMVVLDTPHLFSCGELKRKGSGLRMVVKMLSYIVDRVFKRNLDSTAVNPSSHIIPNLSALCRNKNQTTVHPGGVEGNWDWSPPDGHFLPLPYSRRFVHGTSPSAGGSMPPHAKLSSSRRYAAGLHDPGVTGEGNGDGRLTGPVASALFRLQLGPL